MKRYLVIFTIGLSLLLTNSLFAQVPQGISYQSVVRNTAGTPQVSTPVAIKFSILQGGETGTPIYVETQQSLSTNAQGLVTATIGKGTPTQGTFNTIDWSLGNYYLKVEADINNQGSYSISGTSPIVSVPYSLYSGTAGSLSKSGVATGNVLSWDGTNSDPNVALFEVKDKNGNPIFSVYPTGVEIIYDETAPVRGAKGGFAVSGRNSTRAVVDVMRVTTDSTTIFVNNLAKRGAKGGFAVSGRNSTRVTGGEILRVTPDSTRIYTADPAKGFGVGQMGSGTIDSYLKLLPENYFIGHKSGLKTTGLYNTFIGYTAGLANTTGANNLFLGYKTGYSNETGANNVAVGNMAGYLGIGGMSNVFIGDSAGYGNTSSYNVFLGKGSGKSNTGQYNAFLGYQAGLKNTSGTNNVFVGYQSGFHNTTGGHNTLLGYKAGFTLSTNSYNTYLGYQAGANALGGNYNIVLGPYAGYSNKGDYNVFIGFESGYNNISGADSRFSKWNTFIGYQSGKGNTTGWHNLVIGYQAGLNNQTATNQFFIGNNAGEALTAGYANTFVGHLSGGKSTNCNNNTFIGYQTGWNNITGENNTYIGNAAGISCTGSNNVLVGNSAGFNAIGSGNIFIGNGVAYNETGSNLLYIDNSSTASPLVWGDFSNHQVVINGNSSNILSGYNFWVNGNAGGKNNWLTTSDIRLKKNIQTIPNALEKVMKLRGVNFEWKDETRPGLNVGFIAQEVLPIVPEVVKGSEQTSYTMDYASLTAVIVEAMKAQQQ